MFKLAVEYPNELAEQPIADYYLVTQFPAIIRLYKAVLISLRFDDRNDLFIYRTGVPAKLTTLWMPLVGQILLSISLALNQAKR